MIRFKLKELMLKQERAQGKRLSILDVSNATGIGRGTLSKIANQKDANITIDKVEKICQFLNCRIEEFVEFYDEKDAQTDM